MMYIEVINMPVTLIWALHVVYMYQTATLYPINSTSVSIKNVY